MIRPALILLAVCLVLGYSIQVLTPLRLNNDAVTLLGIASSASDGEGFFNTRFPIGYPVLVAGLEKIGWATSAALVTVNLLAIAAALAGYYWIFNRRLPLSQRAAAIICILSAGSWVLIKYSTLPITDLVFFGVSALVVVLATFAESSSGPKRIVALTVAAVLGVVAISVRTIGVALVPALLWAAAGREFTVALRRRTALAVWGVIVVAAVLLIGYYGIVGTRYFHQLISAAHSQSAGAMLAQNLGWRLQELGEIVVNAPAARAPSPLRVAFPLAGAMALLLCLAGLWSRRKSIASLEVFLIGYSAILLVWPFYGTRFWLPVIPPFLAFACLGSRELVAKIQLPRTASTAMFVAFFAVFVLLGATALVYSTRISVAGEEFPERYGDGTLTETYRAALGQAHDRRKVDERALRLLDRYDVRLSRKGQQRLRRDLY